MYTLIIIKKIYNYIKKFLTPEIQKKFLFAKYKNDKFII